jgi:hypothetical protein
MRKFVHNVTIFRAMPPRDEDLADDEANVALGRFMTAWAQVEIVCTYLFKTMADISNTKASAIFDHIGTKEQIEILEALADELTDIQMQTQLIELVEIARLLSSNRHKIVHASWEIFQSESARIWFGVTSAQLHEMLDGSQKGKSYRQKYVFTVDDLNALTSEATKARDGLAAIDRALWLKKMGKTP